MNNKLIDLSSDTVTQPSDEMRAYMCKASVGDLQKGEDPTVNELEETVADLLGKEAAVYLPSGTMCNQIAFKVHTNPGDEIIMHQESHPAHLEGGAISALCNLSVYLVPGVRGIFNSSAVTEALRPNDVLYPRSRLVFIENTHNLCGGTIWPLENIKAVVAEASKLGLACHMDGSRLLNACIAADLTPKEYCMPFDSCMIAFSKGLGAPVGSALAGSKAFIEDALHWRRAFGGAMRQAGIVAAGALYALRNNVQRLKDDHDNAKRLANGLCGMTKIDIDMDSIQTNIVVFNIAKSGMQPSQFNQELIKRGVRMSSYRGNVMRAVTHLDVTTSDIDTAINAVHDILAE